MTETAETPRLDGARVWIVTDGTAEHEGWQAPLVAALRRAGAGTVDVHGVSGALTLTARGLLEQGADRLARLLRFARPGEPDADAHDAFATGRPDLVIADHPGVLRTLEVIRDTTRVPAVHIGLLSDQGAPEPWVGARADAFVAPDADALAAVRRPGLSDVALQPAGPPVPEGFDRPLDRTAIRAEFGFGDDDRVVLVDAREMPPALIDRVVFQLSVVKSPFTPVFSYGRNGEAAEVLRQAASAHGLKARMFGLVDQPERYHVVADVVIASPNHPLIPAWLAQHRPLLLLGPVGGAFGPVRAGAAVPIGDVMLLAEIVERIAAEGVSESHAAAARDLGRPEANDDIATAIARIWAGRSSLRASAPPPAEAEGGTAAPRRFEEIGAASATPETLSPLTRAAAREQLAALIMEERRIENEVGELARERDRWLRRVELAEEHGDTDLLAIARRTVEDTLGRLGTLNQRLTGLQDQKDLVRRRAALSQPRRPAAAPGTSAPPEAGGGLDVERRFRELELRGDMDRLRRKAHGDDED